MSTAGESVSRIELQILICDKKVLTAEFRRHYSPLTINKLINRMPISGLVSKYYDKFIYVKTDLDIGVEKPRNSFNRGDIAFSPSGNFISVFLKDSIVVQKLNLLGNITSENLDLLVSTKTGDIITIRKLGV
jgi:hypothetical protein